MIFSTFVSKNSNIKGDRNSDKLNPLNTLRNLKMANLNKLVITHLNINSIRNKFETLRSLIAQNIDICVISESKLDGSFPTNQFLVDGYAPPFRLDRNKHGGGVLIYVRDDIPCKLLKSHYDANEFEGIFLEINLKKKNGYFSEGTILIMTI